MCFGTRRDRVAPWIQFLQKLDKLGRREARQRMRNQEINDLAPMKVLLKSSLIRGRE